MKSAECLVQRVVSEFFFKSVFAQALKHRKHHQACCYEQLAIYSVNVTKSTFYFLHMTVTNAADEINALLAVLRLKSISSTQ